MVGSIKNVDRRCNIYKNASRSGFIFPNIIGPSALVSQYADLGNGVFIRKNAAVNSGTLIGDMSITNTGAIIGHECCIGRFSHISVSAVVGGNCEIGDCTFAGANATIIQGVKIGMKSVIGAGNVILRNVPESSIVVHGGDCPKTKNQFLKAQGYCAENGGVRRDIYWIFWRRAVGA